MNKYNMISENSSFNETVIFLLIAMLATMAALAEETNLNLIVAALLTAGFYAYLSKKEEELLN